MTTIGCAVQLTAPAGSKTDSSALDGERGIERERCSRPHQTHCEPWQNLRSSRIHSPQPQGPQTQLLEGRRKPMGSGDLTQGLTVSPNSD